jgi:hypothetical protein
MQGNLKKVSAGGVIVLLLVLLNAIILEEAYVSNPGWYKLAWITVPLMLITIALSWRKGS